MCSYRISKFIVGVCTALMLTSCSIKQGTKLSSANEGICLPKIVTLAELSVATSRATITAMRNEDTSFSSGVTSFHLIDAGNGKRVVQVLWIQSRAALVDPDSANLAVPVFYNSRILRRGKTGAFGLSVRKHIKPGCKWVEMKIFGGEKI